MSTPRSGRASAPVPFHVALHRARTAAFVLESTIADEAGVTPAIYRAQELGHVPPTAAVYDAAVVRWAHLRVYKRPPTITTVINPQEHPAVALEYSRTERGRAIAKGVRFGAGNRALFKEALRLACDGIIRKEDIDILY